MMCLRKSFTKVIFVIDLFFIAFYFFNTNPVTMIEVHVSPKISPQTIALTFPDNTVVNIKVNNAEDFAVKKNLALCLAISTRKNFYAGHTLKWLLRLLPKTNNVTFIAMVLENPSYVEKLQNLFPQQIKDGTLEIISTTSDNYKHYDFNVHPKIGQVPITKLSWQTKMNVDFVYLMEYCRNRAENCVWLEDDVIPARDYLDYINTEIDRLYSSNEQFSFISFCRYGSVAKVPNKRIMKEILSYFYNKRVKGPTDDMMHYFADDKGLRILERKEKFDHYGFSSSYNFKVQELRNKISNSSLVDIPIKSCSYFNPESSSSTDCMQSIGFKKDNQINIQNMKIVKKGIFRILFTAEVVVERILMILRDRPIHFEIEVISHVNLTVTGFDGDKKSIFSFKEQKRIDVFPTTTTKTKEIVIETFPELPIDYEISFEMLKWWED